MKRALSLFLAFLLLIPLAALSEEEDEEDWDDWGDDWEDYDLSGIYEVRDDTLILFESVEALGMAAELEWDSELRDYVEIDPKFEDGPVFDRWLDDLEEFHRVSFPSTLRYLGEEAFVSYDFTELTLPGTLEVIERGAFVYCGFDVLRIEATLSAAEILGGLYDCDVAAYEVPEDHPLYKSVDGVLFTKDGKTLLAYPNARKDTHYDVPAGVERIERAAIGNAYLKTISLPIGLKSVGDYAFGGCTRLQAIALPLTVTEIGEDVFYECVSLELVSLPEGLEAGRHENWAKYYEDDAIYRGDNGDTLGGAKSVGSINAPGRLFRRTPIKETESSHMQTRVWIYETPDAVNSRKTYENGKVVYMGRYEKGRVALYEPLDGAPYNTSAGSIVGWADIADVEYLPTATLFAYAEVKPRSTMPVWWNHLPGSDKWVPWETVIPTEGRTYHAALFGPYVRFGETKSWAVFACAIQDADLTRIPDGTDSVYGIVYNTDFMRDISLLDRPGGTEVKKLMGGTQVQVLVEEGEWVQVTDGRDTGWVGQGFVKIVPEKPEEE